MQPPKVTIINDEEEIPDDQGICILKKSIMDGNYRETQKINHREIQFFDYEKDCLHKEHHRSKKRGHYEKVERTLHEFIWVPHDAPSGNPNSFVVPEEDIIDERWKRDYTTKKTNINAIKNINYLGAESSIQINKL